MEIIVPGSYLLAGIVVYATIHHLSIALTPPHKPIYFLFSGMCLFAALATIFHVDSMQAANEIEFVLALKRNIAALSLFMLLFPWFIASYTGRRPLPLLIGLSIWFVVSLPINLNQPYSLQYEQLDGIYTITLPWGEGITHGRGHISPWFYITTIGLLIEIAYAFHALIGMYRRDHQHTGLWMLFAIVLLLINTIEGILARLSILQFAEFGPVSFLLMVIIMGASLAIETQRHLRSSEQNFRSLFECSPTAMVAIDPLNGHIVQANQIALNLIGYNATEILNKTVMDMTCPEDMEESRQRYKQLTSGSADHMHYERRFLRKDGSLFAADNYVSTLKDKDGKVTRLIANAIDITERKAAEEQIKHLAFYDHLTLLPNRRLLNDRLQQALFSSARSGQQGALLLIDLDNFKSTNDSLGHLSGDSMLQQVANRLISYVREGDTVARLGGDEFMVILEDLSERAPEAAAQTETIGMKIIQIISAPYRLAANEIHSTCSIGATLFNGHQESIEELVKQAEIAMYQAKSDGRNTLRFFDARMQDIINIRVGLETELHNALDTGQFQLYYQIQVDRSRRPLGAEALIRWIHPERGFVSPAQFIPLAEETGLILPIGQWVIETACAQLKAWQGNQLASGITLAVNVSSKQFHQTDFADQVKTAIQRHAINPKQLKLELTESMLLTDIDDTIATMNSLKEIGVQFSLDDFGTGYSSLQYLKKLPLDQIKIDQSFVRDIATNHSDETIARTIIAMALNLNFDIIAEGVETEAQRDLLLESGCSHYQGYLFGKPVPVDQFEELLKQS
jgi:diguanylate cyclase (GGDEF)-like protein/PAS domain S-box-containing protein